MLLRLSKSKVLSVLVYMETIIRRQISLNWLRGFLWCQNQINKVRELSRHTVYDRMKVSIRLLTEIVQCFNTERKCLQFFFSESQFILAINVKDRSYR